MRLDHTAGNPTNQDLAIRDSRIQGQGRGVAIFPPSLIADKWPSRSGEIHGQARTMSTGSAVRGKRKRTRLTLPAFDTGRSTWRPNLSVWRLLCQIWSSALFLLSFRIRKERSFGGLAKMMEVLLSDGYAEADWSAFSLVLVLLFGRQLPKCFANGAQLWQGFFPHPIGRIVAEANPWVAYEGNLWSHQLAHAGQRHAGEMKLAKFQYFSKCIIRIDDCEAMWHVMI